MSTARAAHVVVAGMHRSGTSLVTQLLHRCGLGLGDEKYLIPATYANETGYWEDRRFVELNEKVLAATGGAWDAAGEFPGAADPAWKRTGALGRLASDAKKLLATLPSRRARGWKDPRNSITIPFWLKVAPQARIVICLRNPLDVAISLQRIGAVASNAEGLALWKRYSERILRDAPREQRIVTHFGQYFANPEHELSRVARFAGLAPTAGAVGKALAAIRPDMNHGRFCDCELADHGADDRVIALYREMCDEAGWAPAQCTGKEPVDEAEDLGGRLAELREEFLAREDELHSALYRLQDRLAGEDAPGREQLRRIREIVRTELPRDATVAVVSHGDAELLALYGRRAQHFPQKADGTHLDSQPASSLGAIAQAELARARGADFLLVPGTELWWLDRFRAFDRHLMQRYPLVVRDEDVCLIFDLRPDSAGRGYLAWHELERALAARDSVTAHEVAVLDWDSGTDLANRFPDRRIFTPIGAGDRLPYLDESVDLVAVGEHVGAARMREARRVAGIAVVSCPADTATAPGVVWKTRPRAQAATCSIILAPHGPNAVAPEVIASLRNTLDRDLVQEIVDVQAQPGASLGGAWNRAASAAKGELLAFVDAQTLLLEGWLDALVRVLTAYADAGVAGGRVLSVDGRLRHAGGLIEADGRLTDIGRGDAQAQAPPYSFVRAVDFCSPAVFATSKSAFAAAGGFAEDLAGPSVVVDYCLRLRTLGLATYFQPECNAVTLEGEADAVAAGELVLHEVGR